MKLEVLQEAKTWLAVAKPTGLIVESNPYERALEDQVRDYLAKSYANPYVGIVHRLDRVTSGVVIFAKRKSALRYYHQAFAERRVQKTYLAQVDTPPPAPTGTLEHWISRDASGKKAVIVAQQPSAKKALLSYTTRSSSAGLTCLEIQLGTGRYHQIRAQLAHIGCPIVGDELYGGTAWSHMGIGLHAWRLVLVPHQGEDSISLEATTLPEAGWT